ncbi:MAG TPA: hypothetical protein V6C65_28505 [Allocoleopsis sp.]
MTWGMIGGAAVSVIGGALLSDNSGGGGGSTPSAKQQQVYDPYAPYRGAAATKLNALMADPNSITSLPEYQAQMQAASRAMAAQGYTGSGNALVAAANAGGQAYQQAFNNLAMLSGAGQSPAYGASAAEQGNLAGQQMQNQMWGQIGNAVGQGINAWGNRNNNNMSPPTDNGSAYSGNIYGGSTDVALGTGVYSAAPAF